MSNLHPVSCSIHPLHIVILNWNLARDTIRCVDSVRQALPPGAQIIVVDNGSTDDSVALLRAALGDTVQLIEKPDNLGFAAGTNVGIRQALEEGAQSILMLNNDTVVDPEIIMHLDWAAQTRLRAGILSPVIYYRDQPQRVWHLGAQEHRWLPVPIRLGQRALAKAGYAPFQVDYANACGMVVRRQVFEAVGLLDPAYYIYFEDADFCRRARAAGWEIWCIPRARMWHKVSSTMSTQRPAARYAQWWGRARFLRTQPNGRSPMLPLCFLLTKMVGTILRDMLSGNWHLIGPMWLGLEDGYRNTPSRYLEFLK